jgi:hypothetical protein
MSDDSRAIDRTQLLPRSGIGVSGPWLVIAPADSEVIRVDLRQLDHVTMYSEDDGETENASDRTRVQRDLHDRSSQILLACGDLEVALYVADGREAAQRIVAQASPFTGKLTRGDGREAIPLLLVDEDVVWLRNEYIQVGTVAFLVSEVREYALDGENLPLPGSRVIQAAMALLVVAVEERATELVSK